MAPFIEWKRLNRDSLRFVNDAVECDVWAISTMTGRQYQYNVLDAVSGEYLATGIEPTEEAACEAALRAAKL
jgi:hypothetical protein